MTFNKMLGFDLHSEISVSQVAVETNTETAEHLGSSKNVLSLIILHIHKSVISFNVIPSKLNIE